MRYVVGYEGVWFLVIITINKAVSNTLLVGGGNKGQWLYAAK